MIARRFPAACVLLGLLSSTLSHGETRYVSLSGGHAAPFTSWETAATNIQDAVDATAAAGDIVLVTNGVYATGGRRAAGNTITNRVVIHRAVEVRSVNGPLHTTIRGSGGALDATALRCVWLTNTATLNGFTLADGRTANNVDGKGGGVYGSPGVASATVINCIITNCLAYEGGGAHTVALGNSLLRSNSASQGGGGAAYCRVRHCTTVGNAASIGGGVYSCQVTNSIVWQNTASSAQTYSNYYNSTFHSSCTGPSAAGSGNIAADPQLLFQGAYPTPASPCLGAGAVGFGLASDLYGNARPNPPSMGCAELPLMPVVDNGWVQILPDPPRAQVVVPYSAAGSVSFGWAREGVPVVNDDIHGSANAAVLLLHGVNRLTPASYQLFLTNGNGTGVSAPVPLPINFVNPGNPAPVAPFTNWASAAQDIQTAIDAASPGGIVLVTNGVYASGGRSAGGITNRIVLVKPLLVQSVNGCGPTIIEGARDTGGTNGPAAVRCAWGTNGVILAGFTFRNGASANGTSGGLDLNAGGVLGTGTNFNLWVHDSVLENNVAFSGGAARGVTLVDCVIRNNAAMPNASILSSVGGGLHSCVAKRCLIMNNTSYREGGGAHSTRLYASYLRGNSSQFSGGAAYGGVLVNCTVTGNISAGYGSYAGAVSGASITNSIVIGNDLRPTMANYSNYYNCTFHYSCSMPLPAGTGNIDVDPGFAPDGLHLSAGSPCIAAGSNIPEQSSDVDRQPLATPPAIGCDEPSGAPSFPGGVERRLVANPVGLDLFFPFLAGTAPATYSWRKDGATLDEGPPFSGATTPRLRIQPLDPVNAGNYFCVASNSFGVATSAVASVLFLAVNQNSQTPSLPYATWDTAAHSIQDAVDAASEGQMVLVAPGLYNAGGRLIGTLTNRVVISKPITVAAQQQARDTIIEGRFDGPSTNGPAAVRCVYLGERACLAGFTLTQGATTTSDTSGGGVFSPTTNAVVFACMISNNAAHYGGGGAYRATLENCVVASNTAPNGGGAMESKVLNSFLVGNSALTGGGIWFGELRNCTVMENMAAGSAGGAFRTLCLNSLLAYNYVQRGFPDAGDPSANGQQVTAMFSCVYPPTSSHYVSGTSNLFVSPQLFSAYLHQDSPCVGRGNSAYTTGVDVDGEPWANPPSIGWDEYNPVSADGPLTVDLWATFNPITEDRNTHINSLVTGRFARGEWLLDDNTSTNTPSIRRSWAEPGTYNIRFTAYNASHPQGVGRVLAIQVLPWVQPELASPVLSSNQFRFQFNGLPGVIYYVYRATNLAPPVVWTYLSPPLGPPSQAGTLSFTEPCNTNGSRFYRVSWQ
jgi:hypothetical protein